MTVGDDRRSSHPWQRDSQMFAHAAAAVAVGGRPPTGSVVSPPTMESNHQVIKQRHQTRITSIKHSRALSSWMNIYTRGVLISPELESEVTLTGIAQKCCCFGSSHGAGSSRRSRQVDARQETRRSQSRSVASSQTQALFSSQKISDFDTVVFLFFI